MEWLFPKQQVFHKISKGKTVWKKAFTKCSIEEQVEIISFFQDISSFNNWQNYWVPFLKSQAKDETLLVVS